MGVIYSDLLQVLRGEHLLSLGSQKRGPNFCVLRTPLRVFISYLEDIIVKWVIHDSTYAVLYICLRTHASLHLCTVGLCVGDSFEFHIVSVVIVFVLHR